MLPPVSPQAPTARSGPDVERVGHDQDAVDTSMRKVVLSEATLAHNADNHAKDLQQRLPVSCSKLLSLGLWSQTRERSRPTTCLRSPTVGWPESSTRR